MSNPGAEKVQHCGSCDAGQYCHAPGLSAPQGPCEPGFYCSGGANTATPVTIAFITQYSHWRNDLTQQNLLFYYYIISIC